MLTERWMRRLVDLPEAEQRARLATMSPDDLLRFDAWYEAWAHEGQLPPGGEGWRVWLMMAGRGYGKTRAGAEWIAMLAKARRPLRIALVGATIAEARQVMVEGRSGLLAVARHAKVRVTWEPSLNRLKWPGGAQAQLFSGDNADGLRGPEHHVAWCDELAKWREADAAWNNLQMGLRAGARPRALVTTTPRTIALLERIRGDRWTIATGGRTQDNINLPESFVDVMMATYGGTRLGRQELDGELIADAEGSLWPRELIERSRCDLPAAFDRVVVGVDPPAGAGPGCDACGIVVAGRVGDALYVLADESCEGLRPDGWARKVAAAAERWDADRVVAEANNGGAMVAEVLRAADDGLPLKLVHASRGKVARAEPVALKFEAGRAFLAGTFPQLRGRRGTEWAMDGHGAGESFAMIEADALRPIEIALASLGAAVSVQARGLGDGTTGAVASRVAGGEALRPPSPVHLRANRRSDNGLDLDWVRRSRSGWAWLDSVDAPIGETVERYRIRVSGATGTIELESGTPGASLTAAEVAPLGVGSLTVTVSQIGDFAASREATRTISLT